MSHILLSIAFIFLLLTNLTAQNDNPVKLFNGKNLDGWVKHGEEKWYVDGGGIVCESGPKAQYGYLSTTQYYDHFELTLEFKQEADGNSGVFIRSTLDGTRITGWQVEVAPPGNNSGGIYESYGRGWLIKPKPEKDKALKMGKWNKMKIRVVGPKVTTWLNGTQMVEYQDEKIGEGKGAIALQIHDGGGIKVRWRNIRLKPIEYNDNWTYLFDGTSTKGWRGYNSKTLPPGWVVRDGVLMFDVDRKTDKEYVGGKDIIYGEETFDNFELYLEWKIPQGGNSGIFYHVKEGYNAPYEVAPEYQLIDDENYASMHDLAEYNLSLGYTENPGELKPLQQTGSDYAMHPANSDNKQLNPAGEWNSSRIVFTPETAEYWLNGRKLLSFKPWSREWYAKKNDGKWKKSPDYGKFKTGFIGLQDHDSPLWFRNIKIRKL